MGWWLLVGVLIAAVPAAAWVGQERLIFFPQPLAGTGHLPPRTQGWTLRAEDGTRLAGFVVPPPEAAPRAPAVLVFGGNAEEVSWWLADARWPAGWLRAGLNYRGYGASEGAPSEAALVADALAAFDALAARADVDPSRIVVVGRSLGTGVAAKLAATRPAAAAVLVSPYDSLVAVGRQHYPWLPVASLLRHRFDAEASARVAKVPLLAIVAADDAIIPPERSKALVEAWSGTKTLVILPGRGHNDLGRDAGLWAALARFLGALA